MNRNIAAHADLCDNGETVYCRHNQEVDAVVRQFLELGAHVLSVFLTEDSKNGKAPSYKAGNQRKFIAHKRYQDRKPTDKELQLWFKEPGVSAGMLCGINGLYWIDFDSKDYYLGGKKQWEADGRPYYDSPECSRDALTTVERVKEVSGQDPLVERTGTGGWHIGIQLEESPGFTNFAMELGGQHRGEVLGSGRFCIVSPAINPATGKAYKRVQNGAFARIPSLESIGIFSTDKPKTSRAADLLQLVEIKPQSQVVVDLASCPGDRTQARNIIQGKFSDDRSADLTCLAKELYGWENWLRREGMQYNSSTEAILNSVAPNDIDSDRVSRILATIDRDECLPACVIKGGDESAHKRLRKLTGQFKTSKSAKSRTQAEVDVIANGSPLWWEPKIVDFQICDVEHDKQGNTRYLPLTNFTLTIEYILRFPKDGTRLNSDENDGGYVFRVDRRLGNRIQSDTVIIRSTELTKTLDFANALKRRLGENIASTLDSNKLQHLIHYMEKQYYLAGGKHYKLADRFGQQSDGTWVFENVQFTAEGKVTTEDESGWVFNPDISSDEHIPSPKMLLPDEQALKRLIDAASSFYPVQSFPYVLFCLGWAMMHANYQRVFREEKFFPALNITGEIGQGKTIMLTLITSLFGSDHLATKFTESMVYELLKRYGSIPVLLDDPIPPGKKGAEVKDKLDDCVWKAYNGHARIVRGNHQKPHSSLAVASNKGIGASGNTAVDTRMISINWPSCGAVNSHALSSLQDAMSKASGAFPHLICEYKRDEVDSLTTQLIAAMPRSHGRMPKNLALLVWFTQQLCDRAGLAFNALEECKALLVPSADDLESGRSSLQDFIEYLKLLKSEGKLGEHVAVPTTRREDNQQFVAIYLQAVWGVIEARYSPNFGLPGLKTLVTEAGGYQGTAKFVDDCIAWDDYLRERHAYHRNVHAEGDQSPQKPPRNTARKALFIPADLLKEDESWPSDHQVTEVTKSNRPLVTSEITQDQGLQATTTTSNQSN